MKTENALTPTEREKLRSPIPVREQYETEAEYVAARREAGLDCDRCGVLLIMPERRGKQLCTHCRQIDKPEKWENTKAVRCPKCKYVHASIMDFTGYIQWFTCRSGVLTWGCHCGEQFQVTVELDYTFVSPELLASDGEKESRENHARKPENGQQE